MRLSAITAALVFVTIFFAAGGAPVQAQGLDNQNVKEKESKELSTEAKTKIIEVERGDILARIAKRNETTHKRLFDANVKIKHPDLIYPGDKIRIPEPEEKLKSRELPADAKPVAAPVSPRRVAGSARQRPAAQAKSATTPAPAPQPVSNGGVWDRLAACESGGNWAINTGNGYYGGLQFSLPSWRAVGGSGLPHQASKSEQIARAEMLQARQGWGAWPACTAKLGIR